MNAILSRHIIGTLVEHGVGSWVVCAGSHNAPLIAALHEYDEAQVHYHFDERGGAFFALGQIKQTNKPAVILTTSGTAVAECLPAMIEAFFSDLPLIVVSADRPERFVGTGAPQVISQSEVLSSHLRQQITLAEAEPFIVHPHGPIHINVRFEEPLFQSVESEESIFHQPSAPQQASSTSIDAWLHEHHSPLVIVESLPAMARPQVINFLATLQAPILAEPRSGLWREAGLRSLLLDCGDALLSSFPPGSVIRIGGVPLTSFWRDLSRHIKHQSIPILNLSAPFFSGIDRSTLHLPLESTSLPVRTPLNNRLFAETLLRLDYLLSKKREALFEAYPRSEQALLRRIALAFHEPHSMYLGNSLPIRMYSHAMSVSTARRIEGNRGANGIDGQIASFAGFLSSEELTVGVLGDLTALYDVGSLSLLKHTPHAFKLFIMNNYGGRIFEQLPYFDEKFGGNKSRQFVNEHQFDLAAIAHGFGLKAGSFTNLPKREILEPLSIIELVPDTQETKAWIARFKEEILNITKEC